MGRAKEIKVSVIPPQIANEFVKKHHYSGKVNIGAKLHFGAFLDNQLHGVMTYGSPLDRRRVLGLVADTKWNEMLELNRLVFNQYLPRNSESRCLAISFKLLRKHAPQIKWVLSFADGSQCGDGCIYRAAGFLLTGIKKNNQIIEFPDGRRETRFVLTNCTDTKRLRIAKHYGITLGGGSSLKPFLDIGARPLPGFQLRYIKLLRESCKLTVPTIPFSEIDQQGASMYKGVNKRL